MVWYYSSLAFSFLIYRWGTLLCLPGINCGDAPKKRATNSSGPPGGWWAGTVLGAQHEVREGSRLWWNSGGVVVEVRGIR